ncbi:metallophosphoesterase family protein [Paenibacillus hexagrammi]|uniref:Metallophosphoesterase n=1 Tax=Paenibacillus hexagrammi TaxID=2908839 RepID=A0ABY3SNR8_9BACL|nr:metallophosphoesterase [Paenibacillus sp. YPD9-1]UJF35195.1 metallophosphoesterase [Paenibacillus sp. YPD9-1]
MQNVFIISDHHFGHGHIIDFESRPFADIHEMNHVMIDTWNAVVGSEDKVFHLGDFSFLNREKTKDIVQRLHGYKILILGNHDRGRSGAGGLMSASTRSVNTRLYTKDFIYYRMNPCI